jgi:lysophospholipase L1-like esterase
VLIYEGDNDVAAGIAPKQIAATFKALATRLRGHLPELRIYVIGAKPSIARWEMWPQMAETNALVRAACDARARRISTWRRLCSVTTGDLGRRSSSPTICT